MANPTFTINAASFDSAGYVRITFTNATKGSNWYAWRIYRRLTGTTTWKLLKEYVVDQANYTFDDYSAPANVSVDYSVVRVHLVGAVPTEEAHTPSSVTPVGENYWLTSPGGFALKLAIVTADTFTDDVAQEVHQLIGRGRKVDYGTDYGVTGTLSVQFRDNDTATARVQMATLNFLKKTQEYLWLRNPFGDAWKVSLGQLGMTRIAGVGQREFMDVTVPYLEVA